MTASRPILASLSSDRSTCPVVPARPCASRKPSRILRLLSVIVKSGTPAAASAAWMTWAVSASATALSVPIVSKSHWTNSRNRPLAGRSPRNTEPIAYRLNGTPSSSMCLATNRASGTVRSNRKASSPGVPPLLVTSKICRSTSSEPAPLPVKTSIRSMCGVSIGTNPKLANVWRNAASIRSRGIITAGGRSLKPLATRGSIMVYPFEREARRAGFRAATRTGRRWPWRSA